ncbi:MAG: asparagine synthase (glutamine-hydrolyzing) [Bacteroidales bacterium]|nr:asparagine synthase (glutamine-hydrolyzing) [Bacteroidales bacterium]
MIQDKITAYILQVVHTEKENIRQDSLIFKEGFIDSMIIDIAGGQQPLSDSTGRYWIVFNGEIFNYRELRSELGAKAGTLKTQSDTEVLINLYAIYGAECLTKLNGQFAFAIWDKKEEELFIARDRVGIRPFFYNITDNVFTFSSEIKSLFQHEIISREFDLESLSQVYTFWSTVTPSTSFKNIYELSPGHYAVFNRKGFKTVKYWNLSFSRTNHKLTLSDALEQFEDLLGSAVRLRLRADVEVAAYLSGGIDSTSTVAYIRHIEPGILNTFSIGFADREFDETTYQKEAVKYLNTNHKYINCSSRDIAEHFPSVVWHSETPLTRTAPTPMMILSHLVKDNDIKVVITGEGADEILAGYDIFREARIRRFWALQPKSSLRPLLLKKIYPDIAHLRNASPNILKMFFGYKLTDVDNPFYSHLLRWNNANHIKKHFTTAVKEDLNNYSPLDDLSGRLPGDFNSWDLLSRAQWLETTLFMSGYLLSAQGDRMAMANSVEGRYPFLDHRLIEFCTSLPSDFKLKGLNEKYLLKKLMSGKIPDAIIQRPKQPYRAPISSVFLAKDVPDYVEYMLSESYTKEIGIFDHRSLSGMLGKIGKTGVASEVDNMTLTAVISTHLLHHQFIESNNEEFQGGELKNLRVIEDIPSAQ